jgi:hypothetical protein
MINFGCAKLGIVCLWKIGDCVFVENSFLFGSKIEETKSNGMDGTFLYFFLYTQRWHSWLPLFFRTTFLLGSL